MIIEFLKMGLIYGRIKDESNGIFSLNLNKEKKSGSFTILKVKIKSQGNLSSQRNTAIFEISDQYYFMRDFLNYGDSLDIKYLIITVLFIIIWKLLIEKKKKK